MCPRQAGCHVCCCLAHVAAMGGALVSSILPDTHWQRDFFALCSRHGAGRSNRERPRIGALSIPGAPGTGFFPACSPVSPAGAAPPPPQSRGFVLGSLVGGLIALNWLPRGFAPPPAPPALNGFCPWGTCPSCPTTRMARGDWGPAEEESTLAPGGCWLFPGHS